MSWDSYIDNLKAQSKDTGGTPHIDRACIISLDGGCSWTTQNHPENFELYGEEGCNLAAAMKSKDFTKLQANGIHLGGTKYQYLRAEDNSVLGKRKEKGAVSIQRSKTAIVVGHCPEGSQQGYANKAVASVAEYLESLGM